MSAWWARLAANAEQLAVQEYRGDQGHVGQVGAAPVGVVEDPGDPGPLLLAEHRGDRVGHRAEVDGDVLGLHHQLAVGVEEGGRAVVALLDVGRVGGADQRRAHLIAGGAQAADQDLERDRVEAVAAHRATSARDRAVRRRPSALQPGGSTSVASGSSKTTGPAALASRPAARRAGPASRPTPRRSGPRAGPRSRRPAGAATGRGLGAGRCAARGRMSTSTTSPSGSRWP